MIGGKGDYVNGQQETTPNKQRAKRTQDPSLRFMPDV
jgi:hypothetical protein